jgi:hypothetical protein
MFAGHGSWLPTQWGRPDARDGCVSRRRDAGTVLLDDDLNDLRRKRRRELRDRGLLSLPVSHAGAATRRTPLKARFLPRAFARGNVRSSARSIRRPGPRRRRTRAQALLFSGCRTASSATTLVQSPSNGVFAHRHRRVLGRRHPAAGSVPRRRSKQLPSHSFPQNAQSLDQGGATGSPLLIRDVTAHVPRLTNSHA